MASKQPKRRGVSNPRLLISVEDKIAAHGLDPVPYEPLIQAIKDDIVADETRSYRPTITEVAGK